jgi:hypothetical protein
VTIATFRRTLAALVAAGAFLALAGPASAASLHGTVVHHNSKAHSFALATRSGRLYAIHARHLPRTGRTVSVLARRLRNGTYAATRIRVGGSRRHVRLRGVVTFATRRGLVVSARGVSLFVRRRAAGARAADSTQVGDEVEVEGTVDDQGQVDATTVTPTGAQQSTVDLEGVIIALDAGARTLTLSADDDEQSGGTMTVTIPAGFDFSLFQVGQEVELQATPTGTGTFTAVQSSGDDNAQEADDAGDDQGDGGGNQGGSGGGDQGTSGSGGGDD